MKIKLFITGGTIDKEYNELNGELIFRKSHLPEMLEQAKSKADIKSETIMLKDSLYINNSDRKKILKKCKSCKQDKIIITHGTDTMVETAKVLGKNIKDKTIMLTGAMVPFSFGNSDALFNLGGAIIAAQALPKGVYIIMNGKIFEWDNVMKDKKIGEFKTKKKQMKQNK